MSPNKSRIGLLCVSLACAASALMATSCAQDAGWNDDGGGPPPVGADGGKTNPPPNPAVCPPCVTDKDCTGGAICSQIGGDSYCAAPCPNGNECDSSHTCQLVTSVVGDAVNVCVPNNNACGAPIAPPSSGGPDAGSAPPPPSNSCPGLASPTTKAGCSSCYGTQTCQPNGCYGGWWCNTQTVKCQAPPTNCGTSGGGTDGGGGGGNVVIDGGVNANIGITGGTESQLYFAIIGDTRPAVEDDTSAYPSAVIGQIFSDVNGLKPMPPFAVATGDYQFSNPSGTQASAQLSLYLTARKNYTGMEFPTMGNHECTGATASNCASTTTNNYDSYMSMMLGPLQQTLPYYVIHVNAPNNAWTAKFVFVAANAWDTTQSNWLSSTLAQSTTYTFIIRHESATANTAPGVTPSEQIMAQYPYTLSIVGHSHTYGHPSTQEVLFGNGGAPLTSGNYGYGLVTQRSDGALQVDAMDYSSNQPDLNFRFAVKADGTLTP